MTTFWWRLILLRSVSVSIIWHDDFEQPIRSYYPLISMVIRYWVTAALLIWESGNETGSIL